jgi:hypothetical protein
MSFNYPKPPYVRPKNKASKRINSYSITNQSKGIKVKNRQSNQRSKISKRKL